jgi:hypothetical protein
MQMTFSLLNEFKNGPPAKDAKITCTNSKLSAPISEKDADHGASVEQAIETWCNDNDGKDVGPDGIYWRWGVTKLGVPNRSSFWLRAAQTCGQSRKLDKQQCKKSLTAGMKQCDKGPVTHGHRADLDCLAYNIDLSGNVDPALPPWSSPRSIDSEKFPPPLDKERAPTCDSGKGARPVTDEDLNKAISAFCRDGAKINGFSSGGRSWENMFDYPPENEPQWFPNDALTMHLAIGAESVKNGGPLPYDAKDMRWCESVCTSCTY